MMRLSPMAHGLANAVEDALSDEDIVIRRIPITPDYLFRLTNTNTSASQE